MWHGYIAIEDLGMNQNQRQTLFAIFETLSPATLTDQPKHKNQFRRSLDGSKAILEMLFDEDDLSIAAFRQKLAATFGVQAGNIGVVQTQREYGWSWTPIWTFSRNSVSYFRVALFGGVGADWQQSRDACANYLRRNSNEFDQNDIRSAPAGS